MSILREYDRSSARRADRGPGRSGGHDRLPPAPLRWRGWTSPRNARRCRPPWTASGGDVDRPHIATYNSFAGNIARDHALRVGADPDARLITEAGAWQLADDVVQGWEQDLATERSPGAVTQAVLGLAGGLGENLLDPGEARELLADLRSDLLDRSPDRRKRPSADVLKVAAAIEERIALLDVVEAYERRKRDRGLIGFADQVALAARIADAVPEVGAQLREQYRVVLLDEFQDTSVAQLELLSNLFGDGHAVTAVGDPNQAIYGWRGASAASLAEFPERFPHVAAEGATRPATTLALSTSWRNGRSILAAANVVSQPLRAPGAAPGPSVEVPELRARPDAAEGEVIGLYATSQREEATRGRGVPGPALDAGRGGHRGRAVPQAQPVRRSRPRAAGARSAVPGDRDGRSARHAGGGRRPRRAAGGARRLPRRRPDAVADQPAPRHHGPARAAGLGTSPGPPCRRRPQCGRGAASRPARGVEPGRGRREPSGRRLDRSAGAHDERRGSRPRSAPRRRPSPGPLSRVSVPARARRGHRAASRARYRGGRTRGGRRSRCGPRRPGRVRRGGCHLRGRHRPCDARCLPGLARRRGGTRARSGRRGDGGDGA
ncbi:UvrD-helicase domain-containing protein [Georgenia sp. SUBG003]|uniref:UvrD-helicase domain-containing protein n=1 Tax=Georgenia sp. SUBG003 TaxID=1497974 RepID=UPI003AB762CD